MPPGIGYGSGVGGASGGAGNQFTGGMQGRRFGASPGVNNIPLARGLEGPNPFADRQFGPNVVRPDQPAYGRPDTSGAPPAFGQGGRFGQGGPLGQGRSLGQNGPFQRPRRFQFGQEGQPEQEGVGSPFDQVGPFGQDGSFGQGGPFFQALQQFGRPKIGLGTEAFSPEAFNPRALRRSQVNPLLQALGPDGTFDPRPLMDLVGGGQLQA